MKNKNLVKRICHENLKYELMNVIRKSFEKDEYIRRRQLSLKNLYRLHCGNFQSGKQCENLHALLYSKYFTQRFILQETQKMEFDSENDEKLKQNFKKMMEKEYASKTEFENAYLNIVQSLRVKEEDYKKFEDLNTRIDNFDMTEIEKEIFFVASSTTDLFLEKKLGIDISKFKNKPEKLLDFLDKYKFVNVWIIAIGIWVFGLFVSKLKK